MKRQRSLKVNSVLKESVLFKLYMDVIQILRQELKDIEIKTTQTPFNALNLMYREVCRKEELQSRILGGFLDPNENHGYGFIPLTLFLGIIFPGNKFEISQNSKFSITLERYVKPPDAPARRIDILLAWKGVDNKKHAIIIENKLNWASNQKDQLNDYYDCLILEGYEVEGIVYMPFSSKYQHSRHTDANKDVLKKTVDFDAEQLVKWLDKIMEYFKDNDVEISSIIQYRSFWQCLISNNFATMKALEIIEQLSIEEINKIENLAKLVSSNNWCEARFDKISARIKENFNENLVIDYLKYIDGRNYVQYYFHPNECWVELWLEKNEIKLYIVAYTDHGEIITIDKSTFSNKDPDSYYYYHNESYFRFDYNDIDNIVKTVVPLLKELEKFN